MMMQGITLFLIVANLAITRRSQNFRPLKPLLSGVTESYKVLVGYILTEISASAVRDKYYLTLLSVLERSGPVPMR